MHLMPSHDVVMRTIIEIPEQDLHQLKELCSREHISRAEAIRRAVRDLLRRHRRPDGDEAFALWRDRAQDALSYEDGLRDEWSS